MLSDDWNSAAPGNMYGLIITELVQLMEGVARVVCSCKTANALLPIPAHLV
jgi:hypothetical protein